MVAVIVYCPLDGELFVALTTCHTPFIAVRSGIPAIVNQCPAMIGEIPLLPATSLPPCTENVAVVPLAEADISTCCVPIVAAATPAEPLPVPLAVIVYSPAMGVFAVIAAAWNVPLRAVTPVRPVIMK